MDLKKLQQIREKQMQEFFDWCMETFKERNAQYGDAIRVGGFIGAAITLVGDAARLHSLVVNTAGQGKQPDREAIGDTLTDIANYAGITAAMLQDDNILGGFNAPFPVLPVSEEKPK